MLIERSWLVPLGAIVVLSFLVVWLTGASLIGLLVVAGAGIVVFAWRVPLPVRQSVLRLMCSAPVLRSVASRAATLYLVLLIALFLFFPVMAEFHRTWVLQVALLGAVGIAFGWPAIWFKGVEGAWIRNLPHAIGAMVLFVAIGTYLQSRLGYTGPWLASREVWEGWVYPWWLVVAASSGCLTYLVVATALSEHERLETAAQVAKVIAMRRPQMELNQVAGQPSGEAHVTQGPPPQFRQPQRQPIPPKAVQPIASIHNEVHGVDVGQLPDHLFGQDRAISDWTDLLAQYLPYYHAGVVSRPLAVVHVGPAGVGKRHCAKLLTTGALRGYMVKMIEVNDTGSIPPDVLSLIAEGGAGAKRTIFILCVDDHHGVIADLFASEEITQDRLIDAMSAQVDKQALRRFTRVVPFAPLDATACALIAGTHLHTIADNNGLVIERLDPQFLARCTRLGTASVLATGARGLQMAVPKLLGDGMEQCKLHRAATIELGMMDDDTVELRITSTLA